MADVTEISTEATSQFCLYLYHDRRKGDKRERGKKEGGSREGIEQGKGKNGCGKKVAMKGKENY